MKAVRRFLKARVTRISVDTAVRSDGLGSITSILATLGDVEGFTSVGNVLGLVKFVNVDMIQERNLNSISHTRPQRRCGIRDAPGLRPNIGRCRRIVTSDVTHLSFIRGTASR